MGIPVIQTDAPLNDPRIRALRDRLHSGTLTAGGQSADVPKIVRDVIADVRARGDAAVIDLTARIEKVTLTPDSLRVPQEELRAARQGADADFLAVVARAAENVRQYQRSILVADPPALRRGGRELGVRYTPIDRVGVCVPGGSGSGAVLVSTMVMTIVPAQVAGVKQIAVNSPPTTDGDVSPLILAVADLLGVTELYRTSGTAGVAAMALGTATIPAVQKIVGPGNAFIAEAKRQLFGTVGIDSIAGPSEVLIVADESATPAWVAADMLSQAEHDPGSAVLVTTSAKLADAVVVELASQVAKLSRGQATAAALERFSGIVVVPSLAAACAVASDFATEHLQIVVKDPDAALAKIRHAGAIFVGPHAPVAVGDYYAGPSHVLPTGGTAKFFGPLSCNDFRKASSIVRYDAESLKQDAADIVALATREGLTAHAESVRRRTEC